MSDGALGVALLSVAAGSVIALPVAGWLVGRLGSRVMTTAAGIALCLALPLPVVSPSVALLSLSLGLLGACNGLLDVSMNSEAPEVEHRVGRPIMSTRSTGADRSAICGSSALSPDARIEGDISKLAVVDSSRDYAVSDTAWRCGQSRATSYCQAMTRPTSPLASPSSRCTNECAPGSDSNTRHAV